MQPSDLSVTYSSLQLFSMPYFIPVLQSPILCLSLRITSIIIKAPEMVCGWNNELHFQKTLGLQGTSMSPMLVCESFEGKSQ